MIQKDVRYTLQLEERGRSMLANGIYPNPTGNNIYTIPSQSDIRKRYSVAQTPSGFVCECPDNNYRKVTCKHIFLLQAWLGIKQKIENKPKVDMPYDDDLRCCFCYSAEIIKKGFKKTHFERKQRYECKTCKKKFVNDPIKRTKGNGKIVTLCMDLYFKGLSLRDISDTIFRFYGLKLHHETVRRWIMKFTELINNYVNTLQPKLSETWHTDEQMVKVKGKWEWNWNVLDADTRFLIATNLTKSRYIKDARKVFQKTKTIAKESPDRIITDGLFSYEKAIKKEFIPFRTKTKHIRLASIRTKVQNNKVERFHNTFREFDKVKRGFKAEHTTQGISNGFRSYYNFVRPHMGISNMTPSKMAGIDLDLGSNRWLNLIRLAKANEKLNKENNFKLNYKSINHNRYVIKVYDKDGNELDCKELGFKDSYRSEEIANKFVEFYKLFHPKYKFEITETN